MTNRRSYTNNRLKKHPKELTTEELRAPIQVNGYTTTMEELIDMATRWSITDIAKEFNISHPTAARLLRVYGIKKDRRGRVTLVMPQAS